MNTIEFNAEFVETTEEEFTPEYKVVGIHFGEGDPDNGGQHWNFTQNIGDENEEVCVVKEIQQITMYGGIEKLELSPTKLMCKFTPLSRKKTGCKGLIIHFSVSPDKLQNLIEISNQVFKNQSYYSVNNG